MDNLGSVTDSAFLVFILLAGSLPVILLVSKVILYLVFRFSSQFWSFTSYLSSRKFAAPLTLLIFSMETEVFSREIQRSFSISKEVIGDVTSTLSILALGLIAYRTFQGFIEFLYDRYTINSDVYSRRKVVTQLSYIDKIVTVALIIVVLGAILLRFESVEKIGGGLLASAGIAGIIIGIAAQEPMGNLLAGFQIAFSQPVRIDDTVVVEDEFGVIEEINLSYIVVRLWDKRRLILPIRYFTSKPFQNWTRSSAQVVGTIFLYLDYTTSIQDLRKAFERILEKNMKWDGDVKVLQVVDATEKTVQVRALVSATDAATLWDLRCEVREELVAHLQAEQPNSLPMVRNQVRLSEDKSKIL